MKLIRILLLIVSNYLGLYETRRVSALPTGTRWSVAMQSTEKSNQSVFSTNCTSFIRIWYLRNWPSDYWSPVCFIVLQRPRNCQNNGAFLPINSQLQGMISVLAFCRNRNEYDRLLTVQSKLYEYGEFTNRWTYWPQAWLV